LSSWNNLLNLLNLSWERCRESGGVGGVLSEHPSPTRTALKIGNHIKLLVLQQLVLVNQTSLQPLEAMEVFLGDGYTLIVTAEKFVAARDTVLACEAIAAVA